MWVEMVVYLCAGLAVFCQIICAEPHFSPAVSIRMDGWMDGWRDGQIIYIDGLMDASII